MASHRDTLKHCMLRYPMLFEQPFDVDCHLFIVAGNGYHWMDGELLDDGSNSKPLNERAVADATRAALAERVLDARARDAKRAAEALADAQEEDEGTAPASGFHAMRGPSLDFALGEERRAWIFEFTAAHLDRIIDSARAPSKADLYPCCVDYAKIFAFPDDVAADWLLAMDRFAQSLVAILRAKERSGAALDDSDRLYLERLPMTRERMRHLLRLRGL